MNTGVAEDLPSTKPYLIRAIHEWCTDNGFTPHIVVKVDDGVRVPHGFVKDGQIVLNVGYEATGHLQMDNDGVSFQARFGGVVCDIFSPIENISAIYARENGAGMAFEPEKRKPQLSPVKQGVSVEAEDEPPNPDGTPPATRPRLKLVK